jgi:hypothetical protein
MSEWRLIGVEGKAAVEAHFPHFIRIEPPRVAIPVLPPVELGASRDPCDCFRSDKYTTMLVKRALGVESLTCQVFDPFR